MNHKLEDFKLNTKLNKDLEQMNKELKLDQKMIDNQKTEELYKLEMLKETQMMRQQLETQQMMNMLRLMRANIENNNNKIVK